jgi:hypothetical protein
MIPDNVILHCGYAYVLEKWAEKWADLQQGGNFYKYDEESWVNISKREFDKWLCATPAPSCT